MLLLKDLVAKTTNKLYTSSMIHHFLRVGVIIVAVMMLFSSDVLPATANHGPRQDCICTKQYDPVCAYGETYGNACEASCQGFHPDEYTPGACGAEEKPQPTSVATIAPIPVHTVPAITPDPTIACPVGYRAARICTNMIPEVCTTTCELEPTPTVVPTVQPWWYSLLRLFFKGW